MFPAPMFPQAMSCRSSNGVTQHRGCLGNRTTANPLHAWQELKSKQQKTSRQGCSFSFCISPYPSHAAYDNDQTSHCINLCGFAVSFVGTVHRFFQWLPLNTDDIPDVKNELISRASHCRSVLELLHHWLHCTQLKICKSSRFVL